MPAFVRVDLFDRLACQGQTKLGALYERDVEAATDVLAIDDVESLTLVLPRVDRLGDQRQVVTNLAARNIATVVWDDGSIDERRVALIDDGTAIGGKISITANPLIQDLSEGADSSTGKGYVSAVSGCFRVFDFAVVGLTATQIWDTYIIPACPSWVTRGTIDSSVVIPSLSWNRLTPHALALLVRDTLRRMNVTCELRLRRNGTTDYKLDLVAQIGSTATVPIFHPRTSLHSMKRRRDTTNQATRLFVTGETDPSGLAGIPGRARWKVTNVDAGNKKLTLADPNGGAGPILATDQWKNAYVARVLTGRTFQIQASDSAAQTVTLLELSTFAVDEMVELRLSEPLNNTRVIFNPSPRYAVSSIGGAAEYIALSSNPVTVDGQFTDWYARVWTASVGGSVRVDIRVTGSTASNDHVACAVGGAASVQLTDYVEFVQIDGAGEIPSYLEHPSALATYGVKAADLAVGTALGVTQFVKNGWMRAWSNSSNPPDGWTLLQGAFPGATSRNSNTDYTRYGGYSYSLDWKENAVYSPRIDIIWAPGNTRVSVRAFVFFTTFTADHVFTVGIYKLDAAGAITGGALGETVVVPVDFSGSVLPGWTQVPTGAWITIEIKAVEIAAYQIPYGMCVVVQDQNPTAGQSVGYLDSVEVCGFVDNPATVYEHGDSVVLHQAGNRHLADNATPPVAYDVAIADLERADPTEWAGNALTLGGNVRVVDPDFGIDATVRLLRLQRDLLRPKNTMVGLSTLPALLTQDVAVTA